MASLDAGLAQLRNGSSTSGNISKRIEQLEATVRDLAGALMPAPDCVACQAAIRLVFEGHLEGQRPWTATERARLNAGLCPDCGQQRPAGQSVIRLRHENVSGVPLGSLSPLPRVVGTPLETPEMPEPEVRRPSRAPVVSTAAISSAVAPVVSTPVAASPLWPCPTCGAGVTVAGQLCNGCALAVVERRSYLVPGSRRR